MDAMRAALDRYVASPDESHLTTLQTLVANRPLIAGAIATDLQRDGRLPAADLLYRLAEPHWQPAFGLSLYNNLAALACQDGDHDATLTWIRHAIAMDPVPGAALAHRLAKSAQYVGAMTAFWRHMAMATAISPDRIEYWSSCYVEDCFRSMPGQGQDREYRTGPPPLSDAPRPPRPAMRDHPVRIVLIGRDFGSVSSFSRMHRPFHHMPDQGFDVTCVSIRDNHDPASTPVPGFTYLSVPEGDDRALGECLEGLKPDVILDLVSHGQPQAYLALARRPAPLILGWSGNGISSGTALFDAFLTDNALAPPGADRHYSEPLIRMPGTSVTVQPYGAYPENHGLPADRTGGITFGAYHRLSKITPQALELWGRILTQVPESRLIIKAAFVQQSHVQARIRGALAALGLSEDRIAILPMSLPAHHNTIVAATDIALGTFPEQGLVTDFDHLWMGVPTIAYGVDDRPCARLAAALTAGAGAPFLATRSAEDYVRTAVELAADRSYLRRARTRFRPNLVAAGFTDHARTAATMARTIRTLWQEIRLVER